MDNENMNQETKICKHCGTQIPKAAKICPNCRKKQKGGVGKIIAIVLVVLIIIGIISAMGGSNESDNAATAVESSDTTTTTNENSKTEAETTAEDTSGTEDTSSTVAVGDTYDNKGLIITYDSLNLDYTDYNEFSAPKDGYKYIEVSLTYENTSDSDVYVDIYEFDCYADNTTCDQAYVSDDDFINTNLSSGRNVSFSIYFEVPEDAEEIELEYSPSIWTNEKVIFEVQ